MLLGTNGGGFRLRKISISGHPILKNVDITFCDDQENVPVVYTTGIIGANGTGKSNLMGAVSEVFSEIHKARESKSPTAKRFTFTVDYECGGDTFCVSNSHKIEKSNFLGWMLIPRSIYATRNGAEIELSELKLPARVIASTMTVTDKFVAKTNDFHRYKGIRNENSASTTGTRTIIRKTVDSLMDCMSSKSQFQDELRVLLRNLDLDEHLYVSYGMRYKHVFLDENMNVAMLRERFENWDKYFNGRKFAPWGFNNYDRRLRDDEDSLRAAADFLAEKARSRERGRSVIVNYDLMAMPEEFQRDAKALKTLTMLDLVSFPSVNVVKKQNAFGLENSSSGETHLLCQFIGIMADIRHNSLVLIDEPENSSHPDWQMNYVDWLKEIFSEYHDCHFIIATHSPLILANMKPSESTIVRLKRVERNKIIDEGGMERGCYSWTVDEILQEVMKMKKEYTNEYENAIKSFELAIKENNRLVADLSYKKLKTMINPNNVLLELLKIQKAAIDD